VVTNRQTQSDPAASGDADQVGFDALGAPAFATLIAEKRFGAQPLWFRYRCGNTAQHCAKGVPVYFEESGPKLEEIETIGGRTLEQDSIQHLIDSSEPSKPLLNFGDLD
jgi:hypothetical protein